jgi:threonine aldolase
MQAAVACARKHRLKAHVDGARLFNAQAASGIPAATYGGMFDSVTICFSKGLGAPTGAVVAGSREFCADARRLKHVFGGALRQAGILAAACLYALEHNVSRLAEDHANARHLAEGLAGIPGIPGIRLDPPEVDSNMVFIRVDGLGLTPNEFCHALLRHGVRMGGYPGGRVRAVTHLDVDRAGIDRAVEAVRAVAGAGAAAR